ncbi:hypothetical protein B0H14DRAFT_2556729 [Mycena olivaceomarginata]|nr:hypothetical protein B0H14DRAFT_2556729 [Mycena olivaceomarginata]
MAVCGTANLCYHHTEEWTNGNDALPLALATTSDAKEGDQHDTAGKIQTALSTASLVTERPLTLSNEMRSFSMSHAAHSGKELEALPWDSYEPTEFQTPWLLSADLLRRHGVSLSRTKYYEDLRHNTDLPRRAAVEPFHPQNDEDFVHRLDEDWDPSERFTGFANMEQSVFLNLALDHYRRHVIVKVIPAEDVELQILKSLSLDPLRADPRNHTIPVLQFIPGNGFEFSVQACWYEHWQWPPFDRAASRFEMARQLLEDIRPRNILWNHAPTHFELSRHSKFSFRMAYIDFGGAVCFLLKTDDRLALVFDHLLPGPLRNNLFISYVCMLGKVLQGEMEEGRKCYDIPSDDKVYEPYETLLTEMTCARPDDPPYRHRSLTGYFINNSTIG